MNLLWKLLHKHISPSQLAGFFFANLAGMVIVLLAVQFYNDILPVFTGGQSFVKADYLIVSKRIQAGNTLSGRNNDFTGDEIDELRRQPFVRQVGSFTRADYRLDARMGINGQSLFNSELFFESVPDEFVDVELGDWTWGVGQEDVPIILPRTYINMYNFGFAQTHSLPKISDGLVGMIDVAINVRGNGKEGQFKGKVIGFSNRLNTILVPADFMEWSNREYASEEHSSPSRLIVEVEPSADNAIATYLEQKGWEVEDDSLDAEKTTYFLRMLVMLVMTVGGIISALSFYILMLSIYLLVQKNADKLQNLLLIGWPPRLVAAPYQLLTLALNAFVLFCSILIVSLVRRHYMDVVETLFPQLPEGGMVYTWLTGLALLLVVSLLNVACIRSKINKI